MPQDDRLVTPERLLDYARQMLTLGYRARLDSYSLEDDDDATADVLVITLLVPLEKSRFLKLWSQVANEIIRRTWPEK